MLAKADSSTRIPGGTLLALVCLLATGSARAQAPSSGGASGPYPACSNKTPLTKGETDGAHYAYLAGRQSFDEGDYATAITYFRDAYRRDCTKHELLPTIARAYELSQNRPEALLALETFLKRVPPNDANVEPVKKRIANLRSQSDSRPAAAPSTPSGAPAANASTPDVGSSGASPSANMTSLATKPASASALPWGLTGVGAVAAVVGTVMMVGGFEKRSDAAAACPKSDTGGRSCPAGVDSNQVQKKHDDGTQQAATGGIVLGVGAAAVVGGVVWILLDRRATSAANASAFSPWVGRDTAGIGWSKPF